MDVRAAVLAVLRDEGTPLHWTKIQDLALQRGLIDPFTTRDVRAHVLRAIADAARVGEIRKTGVGIYEAAGTPRTGAGEKSG